MHWRRFAAFEFPGLPGGRALRRACLALGLLLSAVSQPRAAVLWSDLGATQVHETGPGMDILGGVLKRDDTSSDVLYFKFHVEPLSDVLTEEYFACFALYETNVERLAVGNSLKAWAYSAYNTEAIGEFNKIQGDIDLHSGRPESSAPGQFLPYELPRRGTERTIVFKVHYIPGAPDEITAWLDPDLSLGATEDSQAEGTVTHFAANASFNEIRLRHGGGGKGWVFSDMAIATSFSDFIGARELEPASTGGTPSHGSFTFRSWQREDGLPHNSIRAITQTREGYLWVGSDEGLARFDGIRFVSFGLRDGLHSGAVRALLEDRDGALWVGTMGGGLARFKDGRFSTITTPEGLPSDSITALAEDVTGRVWVGTESGLAFEENGLASTKGLERFRGKEITTLSKDRKGALWLGVTGLGVFKLEHGDFVPLPDNTAEPLLQDPHSILVDQSGRLWLGVGDDFVWCREGAQWRRYRIPRHLAKPYVGTLVEESDGTIWAGSVSEGLFEFKSGKLASISASSGLSDNFVQSLLVDREGNLWVGTRAGLNRLRRSRLSVFSQKEGLGYGPVQGLAELGGGELLAGKPGDGLYEQKGRNFTPLPAFTRDFFEINALLPQTNGDCWVAGSHGLGLFSMDNPEGLELRTTALSGKNVLALADDGSGGLWAGTSEGAIWRLTRGQWSQPSGCAQSFAVTALLAGKGDEIWIGTAGGGLVHALDGNVSRFSETGPHLLSDSIRALYRDANGTLWVGTAGGGLSRYRDGSLATFTTREGLPDNTISQILEDDSERLWLGSNRGIACVSKRELEDVAARRASSVYPQVYGRAEGMPSEECTGGFCPAGVKTKSGRLCFSTMKGIIVADPRADDANAPAPPVVVEEVLLDGVSAGDKLEPGAVPKLTIPPGRHTLEFRYTGLSLSAPERLRFRYRLEPLDPGWVTGRNERSAPYGYVPPGQYTFRVCACGSNGQWSQEGAMVKLEVLPQFWQAWWFMGATGLGLLASVGGAARLVEKKKLGRRLRHLEEERALEKERTRIAQDLHDELGSSLTRMSLLSDQVIAERADPAQVEAHVRKIAQSADQTVRALEEIVWALRPGSDSLQSLIEYIAHFANELFEGSQTRCRLDLPPQLPPRPLPPETRHDIFLVVKEALTNALKHSGAKEVRVQAVATGARLQLLVQDDGRGFDSASSARPARQGLGNMRRRAERIGAQLEISSSPGQGTCVRLRVDLPES